MKKIKLFIVLAFCFAINLQAQTECNFSPGRIGTGSETICYNGNPALITNSETNNAIALFNVNEALFGIHNDIIALPSDVWFTGNYTIESWVKPQKVQMYIFANGASYENRMIGNVFESFAGGQDFVSFAYGDENTYTPKLRVGGSNGTSSITSSIAIPENQWSHLAVTFNGTTATMYINGQVVATGPMALPTSVLRTYNRIGNGRSIGQFDEVRIWNVYRTAEEIMATMNVPLLGSETGLKAYYDCNQGTAYVNNASITTLIDKSPNNKNATLSNFYMVEDQSNFVNGSPATINASGGSGTFTYKWQANGVDIANSNSATFDPPVGLTTTTTYTRFAEDETCNTFKQSLGSRVVTVRENFLSGEISSAGESICNNGDPAEIGSTTAASGGDGAITYKWQANGVDIANSNSATYDPPAGLTATTTYTRFAKEGTCNTSFTPSSGSYVVTMRGNFSSGEISSAGESICNNGDPAVIGSTTAASGGDGAFTYKWQANGAEILNSNSATYDPPAGLTAATTYMRFAEDQTCNTIQQSIGSYVVTLTDLPASVNIISDNNVYPNPITFTANAVNGGTSPTYQWYEGTTAVGTNSATYTISTLTVGQSLAIKVVMTSSATPCLTGSPATSNTINIASPIVPSISLVSAGIGVASTEMDPSALLEVKSDTKGFLPPRMTATERDAIASPVAGLILYCSNCGANGELEVYNGATWTNLGGSAAAAIVGSATATSIVSDPTNFNIKTNTVVAVDQLDITPSADFSLNTGITRNTTATNSIINAAISRYYKFGATTNAFSGILKINYDESELNGIAESNLTLLYHNGTAWTSDVNSSNNATDNFVQSSSLSSVVLNEVTPGIACLNVGLADATATASSICADATTTLTYSGLTGTNASVTWTANADGTGTTYGTGTPSGAVGPGTYYAYATGDCGSAVSIEVKVATTPKTNPTFTQVSQVCSGATMAALPPTSVNEIEGTWSPVLNNLETTEYTFTPTEGQCANTATMTITVTPNVFYYADTDGDGFGNPAVSQQSCIGAPIGYVTNNTDCDDTDSAIYPNSTKTIPIGLLTGSNTICNGTTVTYTIDPVANATSYQWTLPAGATGTSTSTSIAVTFGSTYTVGNLCVKAVNGACLSASTCLTITPFTAVPATPGVITGPVTIAPNTTKTYTIVPVVNATSYAWTTPANATLVSGQGTTSATFDFGLGYTTGAITVKANNCKGNSATRSLSVKKVGVSALRATQCGATLAAINTTIYANSIPGATKYRFEVSNGGTSQSFETTNYYFNLTQLTIKPNYNTTYPIRVAVLFDNVWQDYGASCSVTTPVAPLTTKVKATQCGQTLAFINSTISADVVVNANKYQFEIRKNDLDVKELTSDLYYTRLTNLAVGADYGTTYSIRVKYSFDTGVTWSDYGTSCTVSTPAVPLTTKVKATQCGQTLALINSTLSADVITYANKFQFEIRKNDIVVQELTSDLYYTRLTNLTATAQYGTTYGVRVRYSFDNGTTWSDYGASCSVTTPVAPLTTKVKATQCGTTLALINSTLSADVITYANKYKFEISKDNAVIQELTSSLYYTRLTNLTAGAQNGTTYSIRVRYSFDNGSTWSAYGIPCNVTSPSAQGLVIAARNSPEATISVYPNPFSSTFKVTTTFEGAVNVRIIDITGKLIEQFDIEAGELASKEFGQEYVPGMYHVTVTQDMNAKNFKIVKSN